MAEIATDTPLLPTSSRLNRLTPQAVFLLVAGFFGLAMVFITPPVQVPDEPHHWFRIYQLTQGKLLTETRFHLADGRTLERKNYKPSDGPIDYWIHGGDIPVTVLAYQSNVYAAIPYHSNNKTSIRQILGMLKIPLDPRLCRFELFPNTALYTIVPYAPQTLTMLIARKLKWPALGLMYAGRVGTLLGYLLLGWAAIRISPILKWPACFVLASPMALFLAASLSADPITTAVCFLATAVALRCIFSTGPLSNGHIASLAFSMIAVALCKPAYFPIAFLVFAIPANRWGAHHRRWILPLAILLLTVGVFASWSAFSGASHVKENGPGPQLQLHWIMQHKMAYVKVMQQTLLAHSVDVTNSTVGNLGWVDTPLLPGIIDFIYIAFLWIVLAYDEPLKLRFQPRLIAGIAVIVSIGFIVTANYMVWDETGAAQVDGLQGRYFLPIAMLFCMIIRRKGAYIVQPKWMLALMSAISLYTLWVLIERYYLPAGMFMNLMSGSPLHA